MVRADIGHYKRPSKKWVWIKVTVENRHSKRKKSIGFGDEIYIYIYGLSKHNQLWKIFLRYFNEERRE